jgi:hypothetical protein
MALLTKWRLNCLSTDSYVPSSGDHPSSEILLLTRRHSGTPRFGIRWPVQGRSKPMTTGPFFVSGRAWLVVLGKPQEGTSKGFCDVQQRNALRVVRACALQSLRLRNSAGCSAATVGASATKSIRRCIGISRCAPREANQKTEASFGCHASRHVALISNACIACRASRTCPRSVGGTAIVQWRCYTLSS